MVDVEFRVVADRREGLLLALGQIVIAKGFTLLRQRMASGDEGVVLTMLVRGQEQQLLQLEDAVGTHPLVRSFEASAASGTAPPASTPPPPAARPPAADPPLPARSQAAAAVDSRRVETLLPQLARDYPNIFIPLMSLERELPEEQREPTLRYLGQRVGAWVYKRDFALGGQLAVADGVRHIALPAMRQIVQADLHEASLVIHNSPFCYRGYHGASCHFLRGMLGGLLGACHGGEELRVRESRCRNAGADHCSFDFHA